MYCVWGYFVCLLFVVVEVGFVVVVVDLRIVLG